ncbi:exoribonuclease II [Thiocapsa imhoffii]|uniref:Exoribonuclease II n=1 Tax=Thiocapsa imhoffii TaxID=382777 RepID=A0A9X1B8G3_9GAMM|nr:RNB domain-containing ribonuclease [Thiocapsa imhoffii]MBK1643941.1 exoribonuclease II [Thiocapsa imhoffii]
MSTYQSNPPVNSLVLYKVRPARVVSVGEKIEIELDGGQRKRVRPKDVDVLHPGPLQRLADLVPQEGELQAAWELLEGSVTTLQDLAELAFDAYTPATAWATWQLVSEGLIFAGTPTQIEARPREVVDRERAAREAKHAEERDWQDFLARMAAAAPSPGDRERLIEVERFAVGLAEHSRILAALGHQPTPENAHRALVDVGYWPVDHNPYPIRCGVAIQDPSLRVPDLPAEDRLDLTHLLAYAIDDEGNQDPDDAISLDGDRLWVHVADVAALIDPESELEREARGRGANLYLPEGVVNMLPPAATDRLGLGLQEVSPALSFGLRCDEAGEILDVEIHRSWVRVLRVSYQWVEERLDEPPFSGMHACIEPFRSRRQRDGATALELPEVTVRVGVDGVRIAPLPRLLSRALVTDAMLMAGVAASRFCCERGIPIPYATQVLPEGLGTATDLAAMYALRRRFKPTRLATLPERHAGLGLPVYTRVTSPLRRYSDLLVHQQIRAALTGSGGLSEAEVMTRIAAAELSSAAVRRAERLSNQHWKHVFLREHRDWRGEGVVVELDDRRLTVLIPELALETRVRSRDLPGLNDRLRLGITEVDVPALGSGFRIL